MPAASLHAGLAAILKMGWSLPQATLLIALLEHEGSMPQADLPALLGRGASNISSMVASLKQIALLRCVDDERDRKRRLVSLTDEGREVAVKMRDALLGSVAPPQ